MVTFLLLVLVRVLAPTFVLIQILVLQQRLQAVEQGFVLIAVLQLLQLVQLAVLEYVAIATLHLRQHLLPVVQGFAVTAALLVLRLSRVLLLPARECAIIVVLRAVAQLLLQIRALLPVLVRVQDNNLVLGIIKRLHIAAFFVCHINFNFCIKCQRCLY